LRVAEEEKFLLIYAMFKLQLIKGKTIMYVLFVQDPRG
jgi:ATP-dependent RNA helicase DDX56/DBP9